MLALLGGSASVGLAGCSALFGGDDDDADDGADDGDDGDGGNGGDDETGSHADKAQRAWERIINNPGADAVDLRNEAYVEIEEAVRDDMILMPLYHGMGERFWYDYVDVPKIGALGGHHQQHHETDVEGDTELNMINSTFSELDPIMSTDTASSVVIAQIYETLTHYPNGVAELEDKLVEGYDSTEDGLTWTFYLKEGVEFHDGRELTADDVKYSLRRLGESDFSERASFLLDMPAGLGIAYEPADEDEGIPGSRPTEDGMEIEVVDDYTIEFTIREPNPGVLDIISYGGFGIVPEGLVDDLPDYDGEVTHQEFATEMANGTGPFEYDYFNVDEDVRLTAFDNYHDGAPILESVHWEIIEDDDAIWTYSMEYNADIIGVPQAHYDPSLIDAEPDERGRESGTYGPVENGEEVNYLGITEMSTYYFAFNARHVPRPVRQAVAYVTDHEELVQEFMDGRGFEAFSFTPSGIWPTGPEGYEAWLDAWPYGVNETDRDGAREVLEDAGYSDDDPFEMNCTTYESQLFQDMASNIREKLSGLGVEMSTEETQFNTLQERGEDGDLEMYSLGWIWSWPDPAYGHFGFEPKNTDTSRMPTDTNGYYLDWQEELEEEA
ncbi:ABC transporter substrate-binding protein [Halovivax gelatinilyticus]|uniref:ABC transporter substrate-binding protein n=1 Tax=Halovivax gelatinilyticus TaxID=2961597 RepID=UPI0020CA7EEB|nr:ABC transporter substrate-binding protein [Halovivax gelatinilyticus]